MRLSLKKLSLEKLSLEKAVIDSQSFVATPVSRQSYLKKPFIVLAGFLMTCFGPAFNAVISHSPVNSSAAPATLARLSDRVAFHAAGRANPWISLSNGRDVITNYYGQARIVEALERDQAQPLALASADFDEDGVPDLISGYAIPGAGGAVTLHRGNVDSIYPYAPEAQKRRFAGAFTDSPFLSPARAFEVPVPADFVAAGDFDADGHQDLVIAQKNDNKLYFLKGYGNGGLAAAVPINLPGLLTTMISGEMNRRDGLEDLAVGVIAPDGPKVLVFEGPAGALMSEPEVIALPARPAALAFAHLGQEQYADLAVAAHDQLVIVHGRDRRLSPGRGKKAEVNSPRISRHRLPARITAMAILNSPDRPNPQVALLCLDGAVRILVPGPYGPGGVRWDQERVLKGQWSGAARLVRARISNAPADTLVVLDSARGRLDVLPGMGSTPSDDDPAPALVSFEMESSPIAVLPMRLNSDALSDLVVLRTNHHEPAVALTVAGATFTVTNTNDSGPGSLRDAINQANQNPGPDLINFNIPGAGPQVIQPLQDLPAISDSVTIDGTTQPGFAGSPLVEVNGTNLGADQAALFVTASNSTIRGLVVMAAAANIELTMGGANVIEGNFIGSPGSGQAGASTRSVGVEIIQSSTNTIGATTSQGRNVISANGHQGIIIRNSNTNVVEGNFIGLDAAGSSILGNSDNGVDLGGTTGTTVGGAAAGARNLISGNSADGINIFEGMGDLIQGNFIGTDSTGARGLGNAGSGIVVVNSSETIGGTATSAANVISANGVLGQGSAGVIVIGDLRAAQAGNIILGNFIGTDVTGSLPLGNKGSGIAACEQVNTQIGGADGGAANVISSNAENGIAIGVLQQGRTGATGFLVQGNFIGTDKTARLNLGNTLCGIFVDGSSVLDQVLGNVIAFNGTNGICIPDQTINGGPPGIRITMVANSVFSNAQLGIDTGPAGVNPVFSDQHHANDGQNFPVISAATVSSSTAQPDSLVTPANPAITISGIIPGAQPNTTYMLDFFLNGNCDSGQRHQSLGLIPVELGTGNFTTDSGGGGAFTFMFTIPSGSPAAGFVNGTATDPLGNTSEFSLCAMVTGSSAATPSISSVMRSGGSLIVVGQNFDSGATILENGTPQKTLPDPQNPATTLIGKKLFKRISPGATVTIQVQNADGSVSNSVNYTRPN
jgi:hypothetical protein